MYNMDNQQLSNLNNEKLQVILSAYFADGHITKRNNCAKFMSTNKEIIELKAKILGTEVKEMKNLGWGKKLLYTTTYSGTEVGLVKQRSLLENLSALNDFGICLWFYDDGSLHKTKLFYNLCTHSYSKTEHEKYLIPRFNEIGLEPILRTERKKDGRIFFYLSFNKFGGAYNIAKLLSSYKISSFNYKIWSSETIQKWSTLQEQWKSENPSIPFKKFARGKI